MRKVSGKGQDIHRGIDKFLQGIGYVPMSTVVDATFHVISPKGRRKDSTKQTQKLYSNTYRTHLKALGIVTVSVVNVISELFYEYQIWVVVTCGFIPNRLTLVMCSIAVYCYLIAMAMFSYTSTVGTTGSERVYMEKCTCKYRS